jgi:hypothetical protein
MYEQTGHKRAEQFADHVKATFLVIKISVHICLPFSSRNTDYEKVV